MSSVYVTRKVLDSLPLPRDAFITDVQHLASYNWLESQAPTIVVPGCPPAWNSDATTKTLPKDSGITFIAQNEARLPESPMEPAIRAINVENPNFKFDNAQLICDRSDIRKLLSFVSSQTTFNGKCDPFKIRAEAVGEIVLLCRKADKVTEDARDATHSSWNSNFEKAYTTATVHGSTGHYRVVNYHFNGINMIVRHELDAYKAVEAHAVGSVDGPRRVEQAAAIQPLVPADDRTVTAGPISRLSIVKAGERVSLDSTLMIKTRYEGKSLGIQQVGPQLWISQTPNLVTGYHKSGRFTAPRVEDYAHQVRDWEKSSQYRLRVLAALITKIMLAVKRLGKAIISYDATKDELAIVPAPDSGNLLPDDLHSQLKVNTQTEEAE